MPTTAKPQNTTAPSFASASLGQVLGWLVSPRSCGSIGGLKFANGGFLNGWFGDRLEIGMGGLACIGISGGDAGEEFEVPKG